MLLPIVASDIGLTASHGGFSYAASAWDYFGGVDIVDGSAKFNPFKPLQTTGLSAYLPAGTAESFPVTVDKEALDHGKVSGWMVVTLDDANGAPQADLVMP